MNCDYRQTREYNDYISKRGWSVEMVGPSLALVRKYPLFGTVIAVNRGDPATSIAEIADWAERRKAMITKLDIDMDIRDRRARELLASFRRFGFVRSHLPLCPTKTIRIDTTLSLVQLLSQTDSDVRRRLRQNERGGFIILRDRSIRELYPILEASSRKKRYYIPRLEEIEQRWQSFGDRLKVFIGYKDGVALGGAILLCHNRRSSGIHMAFTEMGLKCHLPYSIMWESIRLAAESGCELLDLDGIYDERYGEPSAWKGLSAFKSKFGGRSVELIGTFIKCRFLPTRLLAGLKVI